MLASNLVSDGQRVHAFMWLKVSHDMPDAVFSFIIFQPTRKSSSAANEGNIGRSFTYSGRCNCLKNLYIAGEDPSGVVNVPLSISLHASVSLIYPRSVLKGAFISVVFSVYQNLDSFSVAQTSPMLILLYVGVQSCALRFSLYSTAVTPLDRLLPITALIIHYALHYFLWCIIVKSIEEDVSLWMWVFLEASSSIHDIRIARAEFLTNLYRQ